MLYESNPNPINCVWSPDGPKCGFTQSTMAVYTRMTGLYKRCFLHETNQRSLKTLFEPFMKPQVFDLQKWQPSEMTRIELQLQRKLQHTPHTMNLIDILEKLANSMYHSAENAKKDMEIMFDNAIAYAQLTDSTAVEANATKARYKLWATIQFYGLIPDNGVVLDQCSRNLSCRMPNGHKKECLYIWYGPCNTSSFKKAMQPTRQLTPSPPPLTALPPPPPTHELPQPKNRIPTHAQLSEIIVWQQRHQFDTAILNALCGKIIMNTIDTEWYNNLRIMEQAVIEGRLQRTIFIFSLTNCANCPHT